MTVFKFLQVQAVASWGPWPPRCQKSPFDLLNYSFTFAIDANLYPCLLKMQLIALSLFNPISQFQVLLTVSEACL